jgi:chromosomal replication initiator protein
MSQLHSAAVDVAGTEVEIDLTVVETAHAIVTTESEKVVAETTSAVPAQAKRPAEMPVRLDPRMTFDSFVQGSSNRLAFAAAQSVGELPGKQYNPLLIHGNSGLGKTHLLHAIGNYVTKEWPERKVLYVTTEMFLNDFIKAIQSRTQLALHQRYREVDVLLIDDIQFMESRGETFHEEIFHTYNELHAEGRQIVLTSDRSPRHLGGLEERFRSRLLQGLVAEIDQPELETRIAILRTKAEREGIELPDDVAEWIARRVRDSIRELEGAVTMLRAHASLRQVPVSLELAKTHLGNLGSEQVVLRPDIILEKVSAFYGLTVEEIKGEKRLRPLVHARHVAMYLVRQLLPNYSYPMIARVFGDRNHTTVISAVEKIDGQLSSEGELLNEITILRKQLAGEE